MSYSKEQYTAAIKTTAAVAECIRELGSVPSGHLWARLMDRLTFEEYESIIRVLINTGLIRQEPSHLLMWIGD